MTISQELNQRLLELVYGLVPEHEAGELERRIAAERDVAAAYAQARRLAGLLGEAARVESTSQIGRRTASHVGQAASLPRRACDPLPKLAASATAPTRLPVVPAPMHRTSRAPLASLVLATACTLVVAGLFLASSRRVPPAGVPDAAQTSPSPSRPAGWGLLVAQPRSQPAEQTLAAVGETLATADRERRRVALADGSVVYLNENTSVSVEAGRRLRLDRGEVFVEVAPQRPADAEPEPFVVAARDHELTALGTKFAVTADEDVPPRLSVVQGRVQAADYGVPVAAGQQLVPAVSERGDQLAIAPAMRSSELLAWTRELRSAAEPRLVPESTRAGGALVAIDPRGQETQLSLRRYDVDVHIEDGFARTTIDQTYFNHEQQQLEGTFYFPLPPDASLSRLAMYVGGLKMEGGMVERDYARNVFEEIRYARRDPALLEWVDGSTFKMRVFPLEARHEKRILLSYTQRLPVAYGRTTYRFPAGHNLEVARAASTHVRIKGGAGLDWHSPSHELTARQDGDDLVLETKTGPTAIERDIVLELARPNPRLAATRRGARPRDDSRLSSFVHDGHRYVMLRMQPDLPGELHRPRRHWVILFEATGDRDPLLARVQIDAVETILEHAEHDDTFALVTAGTYARAFADEPLPCTPQNITAAIEFLEQTHLIGALDLEQALAECAPLAAARENAHLIHVGSGVPILGDRRAEELAKRIAEWSRDTGHISLSARHNGPRTTDNESPGTDPPLTASGVTYIGIPIGRRWSRGFMETAARLTGGLVWPINPDQDIHWRAFELVSTLNAPRLRDVRVTDDAGRLPFLTFANQLAQGEELCAVTRFAADEPLPKSLTVAGTLNRGAWERTVPVAETAIADGAAYLPRFWAKLEIERLLSEDATGHRERIVELSKSMYVMSPYTSLLVLESEAMYELYKVDRGRSDHWAMYAAPERINVVHEPAVPALAAAAPNRDSPVRAPTPEQDEQTRLARSIKDLYDSIVVRGSVASHPREQVRIQQSLRDLSRLISRQKSVDALVLDDSESQRAAGLRDNLGRNLFGDAQRRPPVSDEQSERHVRLAIEDAEALLRGETGSAVLEAEELSALLEMPPDPDQIRDRLAKAVAERNVDGRLHSQSHDLRQAIRRLERLQVFGAWVPRQHVNGVVFGRRDATVFISPDDVSPYAVNLGYINGSWIWGERDERLPPAVDWGFDDTGTGSDVDYLKRFDRLSLGQRRGALNFSRLDMEWGLDVETGGSAAAGKFDAVTQFSNEFDLDGFDFARRLVEPEWLGSEDSMTALTRVPVQQVPSGDFRFGVATHFFSDVDLEAVRSRSLAELSQKQWLSPERARLGQLLIRERVNLEQVLERNLAGGEWGRAAESQRLLSRFYDVSDLVLPESAAPAVAEDPGQRATHVRFFTDLAAHAPGLNTTWTDVAAVLDDELAPFHVKRSTDAASWAINQVSPAVSGTVDPAARRLIDRARDRGWEAVTRPGREGEPDLTIVCDGHGHHVYERLVSEGLQERVVCDGEALWHLYPEIGLAARRTVSRFHRAEFRSLVPWLVPPVEDLSRGADVRVVAERTVAVVPHASGEQDDAGRSDGPHPAVHLVFSPDGQLIERHLVRQADSHVLARWTYSADGVVRLLDGAGTVLDELRFIRRPAEAPDLQPDLSELVVLPLPYRSEQWVEQHIGTLEGSRPDGSEPSEAARLAHVAAAFAADAPGRLRSIVEREFFQRGDHRPGFYTLLAGTSARWAADSVAAGEALQMLTLGIHESRRELPLVRYLEESVRFVLHGGGASSQSLPSPVAGFLRRMAEARHAYALWTSGNDADRLRRQSAAERARALDVIRRCRSHALAWVLVNAIAAHAESGAFLGELADVARRFDDAPWFAAAARASRADWLERAGRLGESRELLRRLYMDALEAGVLLPRDQRLVAAIGETDATRRQWRELVRTLHGLSLQAGMRSAALRLALECAWMDDATLAATLFDRTLAGLAPADHPAFAVEAADSLMAAGEFDRADELLTTLLDHEPFRDSAEVWRRAATAAHERGRVSDAIVRIDRALELEFDALPEVVDLAAFRERYANLLAFYANAAAAAANEGFKLPADFTARVLRAADRWRRIDPDDTEACRAAAKVLDVLGHHELARAYLTTPLAGRPNESAPWLALAQQLQSDGRTNDAADAYATAFEIEPTNAQILWDHAQMLESAGRPANARPLYHRLAEGSWQPRFEGIKTQARQMLQAQ